MTIIFKLGHYPTLCSRLRAFRFLLAARVLLPNQKPQPSRTGPGARGHPAGSTPNLRDYGLRAWSCPLTTDQRLPVSCPALLLTTSSLAGTPSPGPPRLKKTPVAVHPPRFLGSDGPHRGPEIGLPQGGEGRGSEGVLSTIRRDRTLGSGSI
jgi:hypothetical protein